MGNLRMPNINAIHISGRLTRDVELRYIPSGAAVADIGIAVDEPVKNADGTWGKRASFFQVQCWDKVAERAAEHLGKGCPVYIEGKLRMEQWEKDGEKKSHTRIVAHRIERLDWPDNDTQGADPRSGSAPAQAQRQAPMIDRDGSTYGEDETPF